MMPHLVPSPSNRAASLPRFAPRRAASLRPTRRHCKAYGALKDTTIVSLANLNSDFKDLDVAIVRATNHVETPPKERHLRKIVAATSIARPRADVAYCIHALARRLAKMRN